MTTGTEPPDPPTETDLGTHDVNDFRGQIRVGNHHPSQVRSTLARSIFWLIAGLNSLLILATIIGWLCVGDAKDLAGIVIGPLYGIFATIVGFFFAESQR